MTTATTLPAREAIDQLDRQDSDAYRTLVLRAVDKSVDPEELRQALARLGRTREEFLRHVRRLESVRDNAARVNEAKRERQELSERSARNFTRWQALWAKLCDIQAAADRKKAEAEAEYRNHPDYCDSEAEGKRIQESANAARKTLEGLLFRHDHIPRGGYYVGADNKMCYSDPLERVLKPHGWRYVSLEDPDDE